MNFIYNLDFVGVPSDFIEHIMPKANGSFVKVYLYALNAAVHGRSVSCQEIAEVLELLESDVMKAFEYLEENGCLKMNGESCSFGEMPETVQTAENERGYSLSYWVSVDTGLLAAAEKRLDGDPVYRMSALSLDSAQPTDSDFTLPDGTVLIVQSH